MSTWRRHRAHRNIRASSIAAPDGEGWTIRNHRAILRSEPYASADLGAASDVTGQSIQSEAALVSPAPAISPQRHSAVIAPAHGDGISGNIGSGGKHVLGGVAGTIQCVLGRPSRITSRPVLHHLSALFGRREHKNAWFSARKDCAATTRAPRPERSTAGAEPVRSPETSRSQCERSGSRRASRDRWRRGRRAGRCGQGRSDESTRPDRLRIRHVRSYPVDHRGVHPVNRSVAGARDMHPR